MIYPNRLSDFPSISNNLSPSVAIMLIQLACCIWQIMCTAVCTHFVSLHRVFIDVYVAVSI